MTRVTNPDMNANSKSLLSLSFTYSGRGETGKHKGLKRALPTGQITRVTTNFFKYNNYLIDKKSVALLIRGRSDMTKS